MCRWENSLVVCAHTCVHMVGLGSGNASTSVCVPSHRRSLPLWETLQDKQSLLKLDFSLGFTPLFDLEIILGTEHWAYVGANLLVVGKSFAWFASASFTKCQKWKYSQITNASDRCPVKWLFISNLSLCGGDGFTQSTFEGCNHFCPMCSGSLQESYLICVFLFSICTLGFCFHSFVLFTILLSIFFFERNYWKIVLCLLLFFIWSIISIFCFQ